MIHFRSNTQTAVFGLSQMYKHSASPRVYKSDINLLRGLYILLIYLSTLLKHKCIKTSLMSCNPYRQQIDNLLDWSNWSMPSFDFLLRR